MELHMKQDIRIVVEPTHEEIACLAYYFFEEGGSEHSHDVEHWLQAQAHLTTDCKHCDQKRHSKEAQR